MFHAIKCALGFEKPLPEFSREEVAKHNTLDSCWIVAGEKVYDVTYFIDLHPAGRLALVKRGGGCHDCKNDYKFHSKGARDQWKKYQIGVLSSEALASRPPPSAAPSPALLKEVEVPIHFGKEPTAAAEAVKTVSSSPSPSLATAVDDDGTGGELDGGEDCVADGHCCQGTVPGDKCRTCPHAPACMKSGTCKNFPRKPTSGAGDW